MTNDQLSNPGEAFDQQVDAMILVFFVVLSKS